MYTNNVPSIEQFARQIKKGSFGLYAATLTELKMNTYPIGTPRSAYKTTPKNPYLGRVFTLTIYQNAATGLDYYNVVKAECRREGINFTDEEFAAAFPKEQTYCESVDNGLANIIMQHSNGQRYLRLYKGRKPTKTIKFTICDTGIIEKDSDTYKEIETYLPKTIESAKQEKLGIANIVGVRNPKVENVVFLAQGDNYYKNPRFGYIFGFDCLKEMFR